MTVFPDEDTIVALSTAVGKGALAIVRMSGPQSVEIAAQMFSGEISLQQHHRRALFGKIVHPRTGEPLDEVVLTPYRAPHSYTGEHLVEITCHNNVLIIERIVELAVELGARPARPGEFTERAFLNHKMDLAQAEAVASLIDARTHLGLRHSLRQLEGGLSRKIHALKERLIHMLSLVEVSLDFNEEELEVYQPEALIQEAQELVRELDHLLGTYRLGRLLNEGLRLVLLGKPNVGKSSLLNALLQRERAIVSEIPGTTRDYIEETVEIEGIPVQVVDTAGVRETRDPVEDVGVRRALEHARTADVVLALFDAHTRLDRDDARLLTILKELTTTGAVVVVCNKIDLGCSSATLKQLQALGYTVVRISARTGEGIDGLRKTVKQLVVREEVTEDELLLTRARHRVAVEKAREAVASFMAGMQQGLYETILASELRSALDYLGEVVGETTTEDILQHIFGTFCIGK